MMQMYLVSCGVSRCSQIPICNVFFFSQDRINLASKRRSGHVPWWQKSGFPVVPHIPTISCSSGLEDLFWPCFGGTLYIIEILNGNARDCHWFQNWPHQALISRYSSIINRKLVKFDNQNHALIIMLLILSINSLTLIIMVLINITEQFPYFNYYFSMTLKTYYDFYQFLIHVSLNSAFTIIITALISLNNSLTLIITILALLKSFLTLIIMFLMQLNSHLIITFSWSPNSSLILIIMFVILLNSSFTIS